jgi:glycosyltransferase involved in cell wall biosynthesis
MNKKKILFLITGSDVGGAEIVVKNIIFNIDLDKFLPIFVSIRPLGRIGKEISQKFNAISLQADAKFNPLFLLRLFSLIKKEKPDVLHCHLFHANLLGRIIGRLAGVPLIISTVHTDNFGGKLRYFLLRITDFLNNLTITVSQDIKNGLIERKISTEDKIQVIYNGVEENFNLISKEDIDNLKNKIGIVDKYPIILTVGRLNIIKGHIYLIKSLVKIVKKYPDIRLLIIGDGPEKNNLETEVLNLELQNNVLFLGEIRELPIYYKMADIFVLPSVNEGFGLAAVEAMSNKLLVVASCVGGVKEIIKDGINGFFATAKDTDNLAEVINKVYSLNEAERNKIVNNAYNDFKDNFSLERMISNYEKIYLK